MNWKKEANTSSNGTMLTAYISRSGIASRRKAADLVKDGAVIVDGDVITKPWFIVTPTANVTVRGKFVSAPQPLYFLMNKPRGFISTCSDEKGRSTVVDQLRAAFKQRIFPVGRLDRDTTGVLVCTNDGALAHRLMHPKYEVRKTYAVQLDRPIMGQHVKAIRSGVRLEDGMVHVDHLRLVGRGTHVRNLELSIHAGRYRVIRRLFEELGYRVNNLDRIRYGTLSKQGVPVGGFRYLTPQEIATLNAVKEVDVKKVDSSHGPSTRSSRARLRRDGGGFRFSSVHSQARGSTRSTSKRSASTRSTSKQRTGRHTARRNAQRASKR